MATKTARAPRDWSAFDQFERPALRRRALTWTSVASWQAVLEAGLSLRRADLENHRRRWDDALADLELRDPSSIDQNSLRVLRLSREEDWSDWLAHLLEHSKSHKFAKHLFGGNAAASEGIKTVRREV